jgi:GNAT superfamily N-acetyltransferase
MRIEVHCENKKIDWLRSAICNFADMIPVIDPSKIIFQPAKVVFLEMTQVPATTLLPWNGFSIQLLSKPVPVTTYRQLYFGVGERWQWLDRMVMEDGELNTRINAHNIDIYQARLNENNCGYAEFATESAHVEIVYFGLYPSFIGQGLGKYFLQWVINQAWSYGRSKIQLNTCELDHPNALPVYKNAGFNEVRIAFELRRVLKS